VTVISLGLLGLLAYLIFIAWMGLWLRKYPSKVNAEKSSRFIRFFPFVGIGIPFTICVFFPGLTHLDAFMGIGPLPLKGFFFMLGWFLLVPGVYFFGIPNLLLRTMESGDVGFRLAGRMIDTNIYQYTRNPMSLGFYILILSIALIINSSLLTLYVLLGIIPADLFYLKYFEEFELEVRFGEAYKHYKDKVSFLFPGIFDD
jgi:protein-S-isoprenylcysteine O-methyltransferase Ste14